MSNMGYCRFENTYHDLLDCYEHMDKEPASKEEKNAYHKLIELCSTIHEEYGEQE